ncbi:MAG: Hpt domain-containing protein [Bdellovibrionota bacterium]
MFDPDLIESLKEEMQDLAGQLHLVVVGLQARPDQPALYEKFGQIIDRIYGTAATFELKELASYCGTLKKICYECAKAAHPQANVRVLRLMESYLENLSDLIKSISDPETAKKVNFAMHLEEQKAKKIHEEILQYVKK